jgi:hypothetical protein
VGDEFSLRAPRAARRGCRAADGAAARSQSGARLSLIFFRRAYLTPQIMHRQRVSPAMLARNGRRLSTLMGRSSPYSGMESDGTPIDCTLG